MFQILVYLNIFIIGAFSDCSGLTKQCGFSICTNSGRPIFLNSCAFIKLFEITKMVQQVYNYLCGSQTINTPPLRWVSSPNKNAPNNFRQMVWVAGRETCHGIRSVWVARQDNRHGGKWKPCAGRQILRYRFYIERIKQKI